LSSKSSNIDEEFIYQFTLIHNLLIPYFWQHTMSLTYPNTAKQLRYDIAYLRMAVEWAKLSHCKRKQVGALIVKDRMIISDGYNGAPSGFDNKCEDDNGDTFWYVLHAEANAMMKVARSNHDSNKGTLYITLSPCIHCSKNILQAGIQRVVYYVEYKDRSGLDFLEKAGIDIVHVPNLNKE
jgi:dCMP deaminase